MSGPTSQRLNLTRAGMVCLGLFVFGIAGGSLADTIPDNTPEKRGDYLVVRGDFHVHTRFSDGFLSPFDVPLVARREGIQVVAVTEHNILFPGRMAKWFSELIGGPLVMVGEEITTGRHHVIALGIDEVVDWALPIKETLQAVRDQGGISIAAHPGKVYWKHYEPVRHLLDGSEIMHPIALRGDRRMGPGWHWTDFTGFWEKAREDGLELAAIGSSDFHFFRAMGAFYTHLFVRELTDEGVLEAIRERRTVVIDINGKAYGRPEFVKLLADDPIADPRKERAYSYEGGLDWVSRYAGFFGLLGLLVFRRRVG